MKATIELPKAFSVRDEHEFYPIQHLMARLNPKLMVHQVATGTHVHGGCTVFWGLVYQEGQTPTKEEVKAALAEAGFDFTRGCSVQMPSARPASARARGPSVRCRAIMHPRP
jgi:hypothetical protein